MKDYTHSHQKMMMVLLFLSAAAALVAEDSDRRSGNFIFLIMTSLSSPNYFPNRMRALFNVWGHHFPKLAFVGADSLAYRERLVNEYNCTKSAVPDEYECFSPMIRVVLLHACTDDGHTPIGTSCKCQEGLLHVMDNRKEWLVDANWIAVLDDDVFLWTDEFFPWMRHLDQIETEEVVVQPQGDIHSICQTVSTRDYGFMPHIPVMSMFGMISKPLFARHESALRDNLLVKLAIEWEGTTLHDITWGLLLYSLQPYQFVRIPFCDDRDGRGCTNRVLFVHAVRGGEDGLASAYCRKSTDQYAYAELYSCFKTGAVQLPFAFMMDSRKGASALWYKKQCQ